MHVLLTLILIYNTYFACTICEVLKFPKYYSVRTVAINVPKCYIVSAIDLDNEPNNVNGRNHCWHIYSRPCHCPMQQLTTNKFAQVINKSPPQQLCYCEKEERYFRPFSCTSFKIYRRKLLGYEQNFHEQATRHKSHKMYREIAVKKSDLKEKKQNITAKNVKINDEVIDANRILQNGESNFVKVSETWDDWGKWSACSVSCGRGRQVRWRHCSSENCIKGLKKAQMKSCHLKDCDTKSFLGWLGIKS